MSKTLVIGAAGQIGSELTLELRNRYGNENVFAADVNDVNNEVASSGPFVRINVMHSDKLFNFIKSEKISEVYHLAAMLSAKAEQKPKEAWELNIQSLLNILELCREGTISKLFWPSSIAVFGPSTPKINTPQIT
ncbi:MAG: NAD-dependent epimerase/dehydratase family protein, partial [Ignavibacteria bacterium]|nr:NAD-dependent epimerase/dehydratase family protein [Ignavibacteria bacterium]